MRRLIFSLWGERDEAKKNDGVLVRPVWAAGCGFLHPHSGGLCAIYHDAQFRALLFVGSDECADLSAPCGGCISGRLAGRQKNSQRCEVIQKNMLLSIFPKPDEECTGGIFILWLLLFDSSQISVCRAEQDPYVIASQCAHWRTPGWLLLPFGQFTFWQSRLKLACTEIATGAGALAMTRGMHATAH